jgi:hypothetical protein
VSAFMDVLLVLRNQFIFVLPPGPQSALPVTTFPSISAATGQQPYTAAHPPERSSAAPPDQTKSQTNVTPTMYPHLTQPVFPRPTGPYDYWAYASQYSGQTQYPYSYNGYYPAPMVGGSQPYPYAYAQTYNQAQYRGGRIHWQQPYQGPHHSQGSGLVEQSQAGFAQSPQSSETVSQTATNRSYYRDKSQPTSAQSMTPNRSSGSQSTPGITQADTQQGGPEPSSSNTPVIPESFPSGAEGSDSKSISPKDLAGLASLQPAQIAEIEILRNNPQLRDMLASWATVDQAKPQPS